MNSAASLISLREIWKIYPRGNESVFALRGIDLDILKGEFLCLSGPSGSGKTSLLNIIGLLDRPTKGSYLLKGRTVDEEPAGALAGLRNSEFGFVFQNFNLLPQLSALRNVALPLLYSGISRRQIRYNRAFNILEKVGLAQRAKHKPNELSGGECQRVAIARALANEPSIILADEPTGNLDADSGNNIIELLAGLTNEGITIILATHDQRIIKMATRSLKLANGVIQEQGIQTLRGRD